MALSDNLQGWWCPSLDDDGNGTTTLTDLSGNGNNGENDSPDNWEQNTESNGSWAIRDPHVDLGGKVVPLAAKTLSIWVKLDTGGADQFLFCRKLGTTAGDYVLYWDNNVQVRWLPIGVGVGGALTDVIGIAGAWSHIAYTSDGVNQALYVNGIEVAADAKGGTLATNGENDFISAPTTDSLGRYIRGLFDSAAIWSRSLTADEVAQIYNGGRSLNLLATGSGSIAHVLRSIQQQHESVVTL